MGKIGKDMVRVGIVLPRRVAAHLAQLSDETGQTQSHIVTEAYCAKYPQSRPSSMAPATDDEAMSPQVLVRYLDRLGAWPARDQIWEILRTITKKAPRLARYREWACQQSRFYMRNGVPSGNQQLLLALQQVARQIEGKQLSEKRVIAITQKVREQY